jgi:trans-aconitate methyltransferase
MEKHRISIVYRVSKMNNFAECTKIPHTGFTKEEKHLTQTWDPDAYARDGAFVHGLAGGVLEWLALGPGEKILDLGCGDGQLSVRLAATGATVLGVDSSETMVAAARARGIAADVASAERLPYADASFDAVFSNAVLHWVRNHDAMMTEVRRVLKPGSRFVAEMGGHGNVAAIHVALRAVLERHGFGGAEDGINYYPTPNEYRRRLEKHGFTIERMALIPRPTPLEKGGMAGWLHTFRRGLLAPALRDEDGNWVADYVRLRFVARA